MMRSARAPLRVDLAGGWSDVPAFADVEGGCVVNVAIDRYVDATLTGETIGYEHDVCAGGLGSSGCEHVLFEAPRRPGANLEQIAERAFEAECAEGVLCGRQDQYAACFGGMSCMTFSKPTGTTRPVRIERLEPGAACSEIERRLVLVDTRISRLSCDIRARSGTRHRRAPRPLGSRPRHARRHRRRRPCGRGQGDARQLAGSEGASRDRHQSAHGCADGVRARARGRRGQGLWGGWRGAMVFLCDSGAAHEVLRKALRARSVYLIDFAFAPAGLTATS